MAAPEGRSPIEDQHHEPPFPHRAGARFVVFRTVAHVCDTCVVANPIGVRLHRREWAQEVARLEGISLNAYLNALVDADYVRRRGLYRTKAGIAINAIPVSDLLDKPADQLPAWVQDAIRRNVVRINGEGVTVMTPDGDRRAWSDGWLLRGTEREIYSIPDSVFRRKYEPVTP